MINGPPLANVQGLVTPRPFFFNSMDGSVYKKKARGGKQLRVNPTWGTGPWQPSSELHAWRNAHCGINLPSHQYSAYLVS